MKHLILLLSLLLSSVFAYACSCANPGPINDEQYNYYDFIARGIIAGVEQGEDEIRFTLEVSSQYKGDFKKERVVISTPPNSAACGLTVNEGDEWLIYASGKKGLHTGLCSRSIVLQTEGMTGIPSRAGEDLEYLERKVGASGSPEVFSIGVIDQIYSRHLAENRILNIYLPDGYHQNDSVTYPVIYLLDGSADEDFLHVVGLLQFCNFPWLNYMPRSIVVGIANTDRLRDFTFPSQVDEFNREYPTNGGSAAFMDFIENELQPYIQSKYKVNDTSMLIGQSLGGLLATEILYKRPRMFDYYFIVSPSLWYNEHSLLQEKPAFLHPDFNKELSVYIAVGNEEKVMRKVARKLSKEVGRSRNIQREFGYFRDEDHASILHAGLYQAFKNFR